jgi:hypothetical protein
MKPTPTRSPRRRMALLSAVLALSAPLFALAGLAAAAPAERTRASLPVVLEGQVEVLVEDYADHARTRHFLASERGRVELLFDRRPQLRNGDHIRVRGRGLRQRSPIGGQPVLALDGASSGSVQVVAASTIATSLGQQNVAIILLNFSDLQTQPITQAAAETLVLSQVNGYYQENSFGQTWIAGKSFPYVTIAQSSTTCDYMQLASQALAAVTAAGGNPNSYSRKVFLFPKNSCTWAGLGHVGGSSTYAWLNGRFSLQVTSHEFGHNFGLQHAHALNCDSGALSANCTTLEYGDVADTMGNIASGHVSPFAKERIGWLNDGVSPPITTVTSAGTYAIEPYASPSVGTKAIKVLRGTDGSGRKQYYYVEYRQRLGNDAVLTSGNVGNGLVIRTATEGDDDSSTLLDMTPGSYPTENTREMQDGALGAGLTYTDSAGISITAAALTSAGASIQVGFGGTAPVCTRSAPLVSISGPTTAVAAGTTLSYTVNVSNRDSAACGAASFALAASRPSGWGGTLGASTLSLSPGSNASTTLTATSPVGTAGGAYGIGVAASNVASGTASSSIVYTVSATSLPPLSQSVATDKATYAKGAEVRMTATVTAGGLPVAGASVSFSVAKAGGGTVTVLATSDGAGRAIGVFKLNRKKDPAGTYAVSAQASSQGRSTTASTAFTVQ